MKQSGGHVKIYSEVGQGTTVKMYFPRLLNQVREETLDLEDEAAEGAMGETTILVVEDDHDLRAYLTDTLRNLNYRVITSSNARSAIEILEMGRAVDLMLTDIVMPGMNGRELSKRAQQLRPDLPIIYMTGYSRNAIVHQGRVQEGVEVLQKPISQGILCNRIRAVLDRYDDGASVRRMQGRGEISGS